MGSLYRLPGPRDVGLLGFSIKDVELAHTVGFQLGLSVQPLRGRCAERVESLGFLLASAVNQPVISIPTPRKVRMRPRHPEIECVMQEQVRQDRADNTTLRGATL